MRIQNTPYQQLKQSKVGTLVRENKLMTGVAGVGGSIVVAGGAAQSEAFAQVARYAVVPAAAATVAAVGALAAHDAVVNDFGDHNVRGAFKLAAGTTAALGGAQVIGLSYDIPYLDRALTGPLGKVFDNGQAVLGAGLGVGAAAAGKFAFSEFQKAGSGENKARHLALGVASTGAAAAAALGSAELIGRNFNIAGLDQAFTATVNTLASSGAAAVGAGVLVAGGGAVLGGEALKGGNDFVRVAEGMGAVAAGLGGVELAGHGLGLKATEGLLTRHMDLVGSTAVSAFGAVLVKDGLQREGLSATRALELGAGAAMVPGGGALAAASLGFSKAAEGLGRTAGVAGAIGLGLTAAALGKDAVDAGKEGRLGSALGLGTLAAASASAGLWAGGESLGIDAISKLGSKVAEHTVEPVFEHIVMPTAQFLFENPVAGGVVLAAGIGAYIYFRNQKPEGGA